MDMVVVKKREVVMHILLKHSQGIKLLGKDNQVAVIILFTGDQVHLPGRNKVHAIGKDRMGMKVNLVPPRAVDKHAYLIIRMPVRPIRLVGVVLVVDLYPLDFKDLKILMKCAFWQFISVN